jgi:trehalose 6-phosphate synthase/phosphatase
MTSSTGLQVPEGNKVLEINIFFLYKGTAARWLGPEHPNFILTMGDDRTDKDLFKALPPEAYTVKVGSAPHSRARYFLPGPAEVRHLPPRLHQAEMAPPLAPSTA